MVDLGGVIWVVRRNVSSFTIMAVGTRTMCTLKITLRAERSVTGFAWWNPKSQVIYIAHSETLGELSQHFAFVISGIVLFLYSVSYQKSVKIY